jgi:predicted MFS family arabinose efflux permease
VDVGIANPANAFAAVRRQTLVGASAIVVVVVLALLRHLRLHRSGPPGPPPSSSRPALRPAQRRALWLAYLTIAVGQSIMIVKDGPYS